MSDKQPHVQSLEDYIATPYLRSFEIIYSKEDIALKAKQQHLTLGKLAHQKWHIDLEGLEQFYHALTALQNNLALEKLFVLIATWPVQLDETQWVDQINRLVEAFIEPVQNGMDVNSMLNVFDYVYFSENTTARKLQNLRDFLKHLVSDAVLTCQSHQIHYLLNHDGITHLPNSNLLMEQIHARQLAEGNPAISIMNIRFLIDRGTTSISPIIPSTLNIKIAELLQSCLPPNHHLYQSGHLLFSIMIDSFINQNQLKLLVAKIQRCYEQLITIQNQGFLVSPVMGAALHSESSHEIPVFVRARIALNYALNNHQSFTLYDESLFQAIEKERQLELDIINAFNNEELELYFQPIMHLSDKKCIGAEVLLRWPNAKTKGVYPNVMVEIINKVGLGKMFTRWLINSVCRMSHALIHDEHLSVYLTLNLRAEDLYDRDLPHLIYQSTKFWKVDPVNIVLEITENGVLEENDVTIEVIQQMTDYGFKLALDDFGTGYSSMARLRTMPISLIKIDQSFVKHITKSENDYKIVESMKSLAMSLGKEVLVEGLETEEGLTLIKAIGIEKAQGYLFSKPMPYCEFVTWAKKHTGN